MVESSNSPGLDVLVTEDLDSPHIQALAERHSLRREPLLWKDPQLLRDQLRLARVVMVRNQTRLTADLLAQAPRLIGIGRVGVGLDNIDVDAASRLGIVVVAPLDANATSVAELALGLMLALARKIPAADRSTKAGEWDRKAATGAELAGKTLLLCGFGRIGRKVAARARAFEMRVAVYDPLIQPRNAAIAGGNVQAGEPEFHSDLDQALAVADCVSVHLPLTPETRRMFNRERFARMKAGSWFINTSRGGVVDEAALCASLQAGHLAGAGLDVREMEPPSARSALEELDSVILTPHIGAFTREAQGSTFEAVCSDMDRLLRGEPALNYVNFAQPNHALRSPP